jgi:hypothetical protein
MVSLLYMGSDCTFRHPRRRRRSSRRQRSFRRKHRDAVLEKTNGSTVLTSNSSWLLGGTVRKWEGWVGSTRYEAQVRLTSGSPVGHTVGWRCMATDDANCYSTLLSRSEFRDIAAAAAAACNSKPGRASAFISKQSFAKGRETRASAHILRESRFCVLQLNLIAADRSGVPGGRATRRCETLWWDEDKDERHSEKCEGNRERNEKTEDYISAFYRVELSFK